MKLRSVTFELDMNDSLVEVEFRRDCPQVTVKAVDRGVSCTYAMEPTDPHLVPSITNAVRIAKWFV